MPIIPDTFAAGFLAGLIAMTLVALMILISVGWVFRSKKPKKPKKDLMPTQGGVRFM